MVGALLGLSGVWLCLARLLRLSGFQVSSSDTKRLRFRPLTLKSAFLSNPQQELCLLSRNCARDYFGGLGLFFLNYVNYPAYWSPICSAQKGLFSKSSLSVTNY